MTSFFVVPTEFLVSSYNYLRKIQIWPPKNGFVSFNVKRIGNPVMEHKRQKTILKFARNEPPGGWKLPEFTLWWDSTNKLYFVKISSQNGNKVNYGFYDQNLPLNM